MPTILKPSTSSIKWTRCWNTRSQASDSVVDAIYRTSALLSQAKSGFTVQRILGGGDLWVTEFILTYDGKPSYTVSIMEFLGEKVAHETQYFTDPFAAPASRIQWREPMDT